MSGCRYTEAIRGSACTCHPYIRTKKAVVVCQILYRGRVCLYVGPQQNYPKE